MFSSKLVDNLDNFSSASQARCVSSHTSWKSLMKSWEQIILKENVLEQIFASHKPCATN